jgi:hypothetical protein
VALADRGLISRPFRSREGSREHKDHRRRQ